MSAPENNSPEARDFLQDPDLPLDQATGLTGADRETALRQRHLDGQLKAAMAEVHAHVDRHQPDGDTFMLRLQNSIEAIDREAGAAARKKAERDAEAYLGKISWRRRVEWLRERFIFSENHGLRVAAALGVAVIAIAPLLLSQGGGSLEQTAMTKNDGDVAMADAPAAEAFRGTESAIAEPAASGGEPRLATAPGPVLAEAEDASGDFPAIPTAAADNPQSADAGEVEDTGEVVASRGVVSLDAAGAEKKEKSAAAPPPQLDPTSLQIEILSARLKQAKTPEEKLVILRGLRTLYDQAGKAGKVAEVNRQIEALK
ncbi:MAG: hypothetical protein NXI24_07025 [bacterium]|nr:hypothetical protein [bacterium]